MIWIGAGGVVGDVRVLGLGNGFRDVVLGGGV